MNDAVLAITFAAKTVSYGYNTVCELKDVPSHTDYITSRADDIKAEADEIDRLLETLSPSLKRYQEDKVQRALSKTQKALDVVYKICEGVRTDRNDMTEEKIGLDTRIRYVFRDKPRVPEALAKLEEARISLEGAKTSLKEEGSTMIKAQDVLSSQKSAVLENPGERVAKHHDKEAGLLRAGFLGQNGLGKGRENPNHVSEVNLEDAGHKKSHPVLDPSVCHQSDMTYTRKVSLTYLGNVQDLKEELQENLWA